MNPSLFASSERVDICRKGTRKAPLSAAQQRRNHRIAKDRVFVEHAFARLAQQGGKSLRMIEPARARVVIGLKVAMHNLALDGATRAPWDRCARMMGQGPDMAAKDHLKQDIVAKT